MAVDRVVSNRVGPFPYALTLDMRFAAITLNSEGRSGVLLVGSSILREHAVESSTTGRIPGPTP